MALSQLLQLSDTDRKGVQWGGESKGRVMTHQMNSHSLPTATLPAASSHPCAPSTHIPLCNKYNLFVCLFVC